MIKDYKELMIWKKGIEIVEKVYKTTKTFPKNEMFGLTSQMRRASISISSNIAEGFARNSTKEYIRFLYISRGSCAELETQLLISDKLGYSDKNSGSDLYEDIYFEAKMISNLIASLRHNSNV